MDHGRYYIAGPRSSDRRSSHESPTRPRLRTEWLGRGWSPLLNASWRTMRSTRVPGGPSWVYSNRIKRWARAGRHKYGAAGWMSDEDIAIPGRVPISERRRKRQERVLKPTVIGWDATCQRTRFSWRVPEGRPAKASMAQLEISPRHRRPARASATHDNGTEFAHHDCATGWANAELSWRGEATRTATA